MVQRPLIVTDHGVVNPDEVPHRSPPTDPLPGDERSLDQVILAYLAEDPRKKK